MCQHTFASSACNSAGIASTIAGGNFWLQVPVHRFMPKRRTNWSLAKLLRGLLENYRDDEQRHKRGRNKHETHCGLQKREQHRSAHHYGDEEHAGASSGSRRVSAPQGAWR
jgi:hypothetical protein